MDNLPVFFENSHQISKNRLRIADEMLSEISAELLNEKRTVFRKRILDNDTWTFELRIESGKNYQLWFLWGLWTAIIFMSKLVIFLLFIGCLYHLTPEILK